MQKKPKGNLSRRSFIPLIIFFIFTTFLYLHNLTRDIYGGDVGDLVTAAYVFGVPHPPGYPLFTIFGFILSHLPIHLPVVTKVGLISVVSSIGTIIIFSRFCLRVSKNMLITIISCSILAFSYLFWLYSELPETFALNNLIVVALLYCSYRFYEDKKWKFLYLSAFLSSLSLTNHHTAILVFPSVLMLIGSRYKLLLKNRKVIAISVILFLIGFSPYIYVPIAALGDPIINWDDASNLQNFIRLVTRADYGTFDAGVFKKANILEQFVVLKNYGINVISSLTFPAILVCFLGAINLFKKSKILLLSLLLSFLLTGPIFNFYAGFPLLNTFIIGTSERFYTLSLVILAIFLPYGFTLIFNFFNTFFTSKLYAQIIMLTFLIIPVLLLRYNFPKTDLSKTQLGNNFGRDYLDLLPKNAVLFLTGDTTVFNTWYVHYVLGVRPDVGLVQLGGIANDDFMRQKRGEYIAKNKEERDDSKILFGSILEVGKSRPVFLSSPLSPPFSNVTLVPWGLVLKTTFDNEIPEKSEYIRKAKSMWDDINPPERKNLTLPERNATLSDIPTYYANALVRTGNFIYEQYKDGKEALYFYEKARRTDPNFSKAYAGMALVQYDILKDCDASEKNLKKGLELNPIEKNYYLLLYYIYKNCYKDESRLAKFKSEFRGTFKRDIEEEIMKSAAGASTLLKNPQN